MSLGNNGTLGGTNTATSIAAGADITKLRRFRGFEVVSINPTVAPGLNRPVGSIVFSPAGTSAWIKVGLLATSWVHVSGLAVGGTITNIGEIIVGGPGGVPVPLPPGDEGQIFTIVDGVPAYADPSSTAPCNPDPSATWFLSGLGSSGYPMGLVPGDTDQNPGSFGMGLASGANTEIGIAISSATTPQRRQWIGGECTIEADITSDVAGMEIRFSLDSAHGGAPALYDPWGPTFETITTLAGTHHYKTRATLPDLASDELNRLSLRAIFVNPTAGPINILILAGYAHPTRITCLLAPRTEITTFPGDLIVANADGQPARFQAGLPTRVLTINGDGVPEWLNIPAPPAPIIPPGYEDLTVVYERDFATLPSEVFSIATDGPRVIDGIRWNLVCINGNSKLDALELINGSGLSMRKKASSHVGYAAGSFHPALFTNFDSIYAGEMGDTHPLSDPWLNPPRFYRIWLHITGSAPEAANKTMTFAFIRIGNNTDYKADGTNGRMMMGQGGTLDGINARSGQVISNIPNVSDSQTFTGWNDTDHNVFALTIRDQLIDVRAGTFGAGWPDFDVMTPVALQNNLVNASQNQVIRKTPMLGFGVAGFSPSVADLLVRRLRIERMD